MTGGSESEEESDFSAAINSNQRLQLMKNRSEEQEGESQDEEDDEDDDKDSKEDERAEGGNKKKTSESEGSSGDEGDEQSYFVLIGKDTSRSSVSFHADILTDEEELIEKKVKSPGKESLNEDDFVKALDGAMETDAVNESNHDTSEVVLKFDGMKITKNGLLRVHKNGH